MQNTPLDSTDLTWLAGLARALLSESHAAEDLVQETVVAASQGTVPSGPAKRAWLAGVARRLAARRFRTDARRDRRERKAARPEALPDAAELVEKAEIAERVTAAARRLPEPYRRTILLRFLEGRSPEEIAREEGKPADTIRWRVRRGLDLLREDLVQKHDRDWSAWSALLVPLAYSGRDVGVATASVSLASTASVASWAAMKTTILAAAALGCVGLWFAWDTTKKPPATSAGTDEVAVVEPAPRLEPEVPTLDEALASDGLRTEITPTPFTPAVAYQVDESLAAVVGRVVDEIEFPVRGATLYLMPANGVDLRVGDSVTRTVSDRQGAFRIEDPRAVSADPSGDLVVIANGFLRRVVPDVFASASDGELTLILERGRTLKGRVEDEFGSPVRDIELLTHSAFAGIDHVSPSQRLLRGQRNAVTALNSEYEQCRARTDGRGEVEFTGLPDGDLRVRSVDPGWTIVEPKRVEATGSYVVWTAQSRLGVRLHVVDVRTGQPVASARAVFRVELTFANGEVRDFEQWVGRGAGEVSFVLDPALLPGLEDRQIVRAVFSGTAACNEMSEVSWVAEPIDGPVRESGVVGVAEVRVELDCSPPSLGNGAAAPEDPTQSIAPEFATLELDVRHADSVPVEGDLSVEWQLNADSQIEGDTRAKAIGAGRYRLEVAAGDLTVRVAERGASGSLAGWSDTVRCPAGETTRAFVILPRGSTAILARPDGWTGEWFVHGSWRPSADEPYRGSWGYSTAGETLTLPVLRPAEWRFELRRESALAPDPLVRTVVLREGESSVVGD